MILDIYFARRFATLFLGVFAIFFLISGFVGLVDQLRRFSGADASFGEILNLSLLNIPQAIYTILPLIVIITTIALFLGLSRSSEMVVTRAAGRSALRALVPPMFVALIVGLLAVAIFNPIVAATSRQYEITSNHMAGQGAVLALGETGIWLRQGDETGQTVIQAEGANLSGTILRDVTFLTFAPNGGPTSRIDAARAELGTGAWQLYDTKHWPLDPDAISEDLATTAATLTVPSTLTPDQIRNSFGTPASIAIWDLPEFIERMQSAGLSPRRYIVWLQMEAATPLFLVAMVMIGASFTLRHQRGGRTGLAVLMAILLSFALYFFRNFAQILGENGDVPATLAAWAPPFVAIGLSMGLLLHREDG